MEVAGMACDQGLIKSISVRTRKQYDAVIKKHYETFFNDMRDYLRYKY